MKKNIVVLVCLLAGLPACKKNQEKGAENHSPIISPDGVKITIPDKESAGFFKTEKVSEALIQAEITSPAQVVATVAGDRVILFSNPDLTSDYTSLLNHQTAISQKMAIVSQKESVIKQREAIIKQKQVEIDRFKDLSEHGAATGKDVTDARLDKIIAESEKSIAISEKAVAEADLIAERSLIIEHSTKLKSAGFNPETLMSVGAGNAWVIADVPENQIEKIKTGSMCAIRFTSFPDRVMYGKVNGIADVMDNLTHMTKVRIALTDKESNLRSGMFGIVSFGVSEGNFISVDKNSLVTVQGRNYVFIRISDHQFERREVMTGLQIGERVIIFNGLTNGAQVVVGGAIQMKGLSFGY